MLCFIFKLSYICMYKYYTYILTVIYAYFWLYTLINICNIFI